MSDLIESLKDLKDWADAQKKQREAFELFVKNSQRLIHALSNLVQASNVDSGTKIKGHSTDKDTGEISVISSKARSMNIRNLLYGGKDL